MTQTYGQGPEGTLTVGFEDRVKEWHAQRGSRCNTSNMSKFVHELKKLQHNQCIPAGVKMDLQVYT